MVNQRKKQVLFHNNTPSPPATPEPRGLPMPTVERGWLTIPYHHLAVLAFMFRQGLTTSVQATLLQGLFTLIPLQLAYNYLIVLNTNSNTKRGKDNDNISLLVVGAVLVSLALLGPLHVCLVLFGAPIFAYWKETALLAAHLALVAFDPLLVEFKFDFARLRGIFGTDAAIRTLVGNPVVALALGGFVGAWLGVLPIPLDWDRPWQQWPITLVVGLYLGTVVGGLVSLVM